MEKLREEQESAGVAESNVMLLVQSVPTRWNSTYAMLCRFVGYVTISSCCCREPLDKNSPAMIKGEDIELLSEVIEILKPFDEATTEISGSEYLTGSLVIPMVSSIESVLNVQKPSHEAAKLLKQKLFSSLNNRKQKVLQNSLLCKATLCDPRYMKKYGEGHAPQQSRHRGERGGGPLPEAYGKIPCCT
ncbi:hypothetical protein JTE90_022838 [Oedothorax gibbosus]|uniref:Uncharacterized protein n=1 Tax=Oedothorax gibbosus TaxID=931172 RepID=A0AAV6TMZ9_9ARAC|nr:hypothetical protein JTE90_022838 [Oedothorax gibbosus]